MRSGTEVGPLALDQIKRLWNQPTGVGRCSTPEHLEGICTPPALAFATVTLGSCAAAPEHPMLFLGRRDGWDIGGHRNACVSIRFS